MKFPPKNIGHSLYRLERIRNHYLMAALGNMLVCGSLGILYAYYGDTIQAIGFWMVVGLSFGFIQVSRGSSIEKTMRCNTVHVLLAVTILGIVLPTGPVLCSYLLPMALIVASLSRGNDLWKILGFAYVFFIGKWVFGYDDFLTTMTPVKQALGLCTLVSSACAWTIVTTSKKRMQRHMRVARSSFEKVTAQNQVIAEKQAELAATNVELEKLSQRLAAQAERERDLTENLQEKTADQENIVHAIHHDLREPLRNIVSFTQLIERKISGRPDAEKALDYLAYAKDGGRRMTTMLDDLLRYTKAVEEDFVAINLNDLIAQLSVDLDDTIQRNRGELQVDALPIVIGHPTQIRQLFQNLISNALKFSEEDKNVCIKITAAHSKGGVATISISDNGIGIPESELTSIFKLFNRANNSNSFAGTGVGLSLCKKICLRHGADLLVTSSLGEGTTFSITGLEIEGDVQAVKPSLKSSTYAE